jgi:hypothetical protein
MSMLSRQKHYTAVASALTMILFNAAVAEPSPGDGSMARYLDSGNGGDWPGYGRTFGEQHYSLLA